MIFIKNIMNGNTIIHFFFTSNISLWRVFVDVCSRVSQSSNNLFNASPFPIIFVEDDHMWLCAIKSLCLINIRTVSEFGFGGIFKKWVAAAYPSCNACRNKIWGDFTFPGKIVTRTSTMGIWRTRRWLSIISVSKEIFPDEVAIVCGALVFGILKKVFFVRKRLN